MEDEKCFVQVYEILNHLKEDEMKKIPEEVINSIFEKKDKIIYGIMMKLSL